MADSPLTDAVRKAFLAGVGALSVAGEKASRVVDELAERGAVAVSQGRDLNQELTRKVAGVTNGARDELLRARIQLMSAQERAEFVSAVQRVSAQVEAQQQAREAGARVGSARAAHVPVGPSGDGVTTQGTAEDAGADAVGDATACDDAGKVRDC